MKLNFLYPYEKKKHISYQICFNVFIYHYYGESWQFPVSHPIIRYLLGFFFSIICLLFGIWKIPFIDTFGNFRLAAKAIGINMDGGHDYSDFIASKDYSHDVNSIFKQTPKTSESTFDRQAVAELIKHQTTYATFGETLYEGQNKQYLNSRLNRGIHQQLSKTDISNILGTIQKLEEHRKSYS